VKKGKKGAGRGGRRRRCAQLIARGVSIKAIKVAVGHCWVIGVLRCCCCVCVMLLCDTAHNLDSMYDSIPTTTTPPLSFHTYFPSILGNCSTVESVLLRCSVPIVVRWAIARPLDELKRAFFLLFFGPIVIACIGLSLPFPSLFLLPSLSQGFVIHRPCVQWTIGTSL